MSESLSPRRDPQLEKLYDAVSFYRACCLVLACVVVVETIFLVWHSQHNRFARAIRIDDKIVCFVRNEKAAEDVRNGVLREARGTLPGQAFIDQKWESLNWPLGRDDRVLSVPDAIKTVAPKVTVKVAAAAIQANKRTLVVLQDRKTAEMALDLLKQQYAAGGGKLVKAGFTQTDVVIADVKAPPKSVLTNVHEAVKLLGQPSQTVVDYVVQPGDSWRKIAAKFDTTIEKLRALNPDEGSVLHRQDVIKVPQTTPALTVETVKEETREQSFTLPQERIPTDTLPAGETRVTIQAVPGRKLITEHVTYRNGKEVGRQQVNSVTVQQPVAERVMVGRG